MNCNLNYNTEGTALHIEVTADEGYNLTCIALDTQDTYPYTPNKFIAKYEVEMGGSFSVDFNEDFDIGSSSEEPLQTPIVIQNGDIEVECRDGITKDFKLSWMLMFVHVYEVSTTDQEDVVHEVYAVYNKREAFASLYEHICNLRCECEIPDSFACAFLRLEGIDACLRVGDMHTAALMWQRFFGHKTDYGVSGNESNDCGCGGAS